MGAFVVITYREEEDGTKTQTGCFGPFKDESIADGWVDMFYRLCKFNEPTAVVEAHVVELDNPYKFGMSDELRAKLFGF